MELLIFPVVVVAALWLLYRFLTKPPPPPVTTAAQSVRQLPATKHPAHPLVSPGDSYVKANLAHLPPQPTKPGRESFASDYLPSDRWDELLVLDENGMPTLFLQMRNAELWLTEPTTGQFISVGNKNLRRLGIWTVNVRGVNYHEAAAKAGNFQPGARVALVREPENTHDKNAVAISAIDTDDVVGYVNKGMALGISRLILARTPLHAISLSGGRKGRLGTFGLRIKILAATPEMIAHLLRKHPLSENQ
ncbi:HIRAN domain-containing protein [Cryobacterium sp. Y62]|uniref:HIRAN domain-containing protein n=1 Tax=Cryobacterium sp. Y62 TaxID=2048284 RepID=UPI000CE52952|nr:HIRAN domain-containing protein [Cryobacterium sp. Y62]